MLARPLSDNQQRDLIKNATEFPEPVQLQFDSPPSVPCPLHGSLYFLTPGILRIANTDCGNLPKAIPLLHRLEINHTPGSIEDRLVYSSRFICNQGHYWSGRQGKNGSAHLEIAPALPFGALLDNRQQLTLQSTDNISIVDVDSLEPGRDISIAKVAGQSGKLVVSINDETGRWTWLFAESVTKHEAVYRVIEYGPGPDPRPLQIAVFRAPIAQVKCLARTASKTIVIIPAHDKLLFHLLTAKKGLAAVYQSDGVECDRIVNAFESEDLFIDCVTYSTPSQDYSDIHRIRTAGKTACKRLTRYSLLQLKVEEARFDGAAGQLERFPIASCHYLSDYCVDANTSIVPGYSGIAYRYAYGRTMNRSSMLYTALSKMDTVERARKGEEWASHGCYPSPSVIIKQPVHQVLSGPLDNISSTPTKPSASSLAMTTVSSALKSRSDSLVNAARASSSAFYNYEDDVLVVSMVRDLNADIAFILFLDGHDMTEVGRVVLPCSVTPGMVTPLWIPKEE